MRKVKTIEDEELDRKVAKQIAERKQMKAWAKKNDKQGAEVDYYYGLTLEQLAILRERALERADGSYDYWNAYYNQVEPYFSK